MSVLRCPSRAALSAFVLSCLALLLAGSAQASFHQWKFNEVFSNADGTIQFIEFSNPTSFSGETQLSLTSMDSNSSPPFSFLTNLSGNTANKKFLVATSGFSALLPSVPPDYVMPNNFFSVSGDTLVFASGFDSLTFGAGALPIDGIMSLNRNLTTSVNSPTNFDGDTGSLDLSESTPGDADGDGDVDIFDVNLVSAQWGTSGPDGDVNDDGTVDIFDVNFISANWTVGGGGGTAVPEPATLVLAIAAAALLPRLHRRRRRW